MYLLSYTKRRSTQVESERVKVGELAGAIPVAIPLAESWGAIPVVISLAESWGAIPVAISIEESWSRRGPAMEKIREGWKNRGSDGNISDSTEERPRGHLER